jgi:outer membrane protein assembly factor BamD
MVRSYDALGMPKLRDDAARVLQQSFPNSEFLTGVRKKRTGPWWKIW